MKRKPTNRKNIGRPRLPDAQRREYHVMLRLTSDERVALERAADAAGAPLSTYAIQAIMARIAQD